jgi:presqualene diphosphate synthase
MTAAETANQKSATPSSFYSAMRILPHEQRDAMFMIYSFCRQVDDIADSGDPRDERRRGLDQWRADIKALYDGSPSPKLADYLPAIKQFGLRRDDFLAIIDGMEMDANEDIRAPDLAKLDLYCDRVASAVGRLSVKVFGLGEVDGIALAHHLGRALQLTNILRDLDEDAELGRLYLPKEMLANAGITATDPRAVLANTALPKACIPLVERARSHYAEAEKIMRRNPRRLVKAPRIMGKVYGGILDLLAERGFSSPRAPVRLGMPARIAILLRYAFI